MARRWQVVFLTSAGGFLALALAVWLGGVFQLERDLYAGITGAVSPTTVVMLRWINHLGTKWFLFPATLFLLFVIPRPLQRRWWLWLGVMVVASSLEYLTKKVVGRPRPEGLGMGFPSGHVTAVAAFLVTATYLAEKALDSRRVVNICWACAVLFILLVGIARVVLHAHWPLDTVGGAALGVACAAAAAWWNERHSPNGRERRLDSRRGAT